MPSLEKLSIGSRRILHIRGEVLVVMWCVRIPSALEGLWTNAACGTGGRFRREGENSLATSSSALGFLARHAKVAAALRPDITY